LECNNPIFSTCDHTCWTPFCKTHYAIENIPYLAYDTRDPGYCCDFSRLDGLYYLGDISHCTWGFVSSLYPLSFIVLIGGAWLILQGKKEAEYPVLYAKAG
jgi:hypothetical protein